MFPIVPIDRHLCTEHVTNFYMYVCGYRILTEYADIYAHVLRAEYVMNWCAMVL